LGKPVRPVWQTGQTDFVQKFPKDPKPHQEPFHIITKEAMAQQRLPCSKTLLDSPQGETGQTGLGNGQAGFCLDSREEHSPREKLNTPSNRSPDSFHGLK
jgi:hypothetical protein